MLNKTEKAVMTLIYEKCEGKGSCLLSINQILSLLKLDKDKQNKQNKQNKVKAAIKSLELDNYYELIICDKKGEEFFCINLKPKGYSFKRETEQQKRAAASKILFAVVTAVITYIVGRLLIYLF